MKEDTQAGYTSDDIGATGLSWDLFPPLPNEEDMIEISWEEPAHLPNEEDMIEISWEEPAHLPNEEDMIEISWEEPAPLPLEEEQNPFLNLADNQVGLVRDDGAYEIYTEPSIPAENEFSTGPVSLAMAASSQGDQDEIGAINILLELAQHKLKLLTKKAKRVTKEKQISDPYTVPSSEQQESKKGSRGGYNFDQVPIELQLAYNNLYGVDGSKGMEWRYAAHLLTFHKNIVLELGGSEEEFKKISEKYSKKIKRGNEKYRDIKQQDRLQHPCVVNDTLVSSRPHLERYKEEIGDELYTKIEKKCIEVFNPRLDSQLPLILFGHLEYKHQQQLKKAGIDIKRPSEDREKMRYREVSYKRFQKNHPEMVLTCAWCEEALPKTKEKAA